MADDKPMQGRITRPFRLKDRPNQNSQAFRLKDIFGFLPETIIIMCVPNEKHQFQLFAQYTPEELEKESHKVPLPDFKPEPPVDEQKQSVVKRKAKPHKTSTP